MSPLLMFTVSLLVVLYHITAKKNHLDRLLLTKYSLSAGLSHLASWSILWLVSEVYYCIECFSRALEPSVFVIL
jgi:hypothetical protein